ncbi:MAG TPA: glutamate-1-semialdehyde 2,1-aminomutase [Myxococcota bacterium]|jgi:glutamate-1-semialdehyde 2,1-aminomutase|nr:glutamate-1-semialdehyde 2,1-aminomutase [Myxococcota bacterium]
MSDERSQRLFEEACDLFPGGVNSPVRAFRAVGGQPVFVARAEGARLYGADGRPFLDYVGSWGPMIVGHCHPKVVAALRDQAGRGTSYGAPTELEVQLARRVRAAFPSVEMMRFVSSGTEATMSAIRVARGATGRDGLVKAEGCYHGHADHLLVRAGSGAATFGQPDSAGVPADFAKHTVTVPFNDVAAMEDAFAGEQGARMAALILEPVCGNMGCVPPLPGYLEACRDVTRKAGALFIMDEVMTGFRLAMGGAQERYGVTPDLTCLGKVIGGGLPVGAYGGRRDLMELVSPVGAVYQAGTLSGNPMAMRAGLATLELLGEPGTFERLEALGARLEAGLRAAAGRAGVPVTVQRVGSMFTVFFVSDAGRPLRTFAEARTADTARFGRFFQAMLERGVYLPPSQLEAAFLSLAHSDDDVDQTVVAAEEAFRTIH